MTSDYGKKFEEKFKNDWKESVPDSIIVRLYDVTAGFMSVSTISDFICYKYPNIFFIECKTHKGASIPFTAITQYEKLISVCDIQGVRTGVVIWLYEKDKVFYVPAKTLKQLKDDGEKSVGLRHFGKYHIIEIPSEKLRFFMKSDYSVLLSLQDGD